MYNKILKIFYVNFICEIKIFFHKKLLEHKEFQFQNISFADPTTLKKIFLSEKYIEIKSYDEKSFNYHTFEWLSIAKNLGGAKNIKRAKKHFFSWNFKKYNKNTFIWSNFFLSKRLINILYNYDFFSILLNDKEKIKVSKFIYKHFIILNFDIQNKDINDITIENLKALLLCSIIFNKNNVFIVSKIKKLLESQIDSNGFHKSYNALTQAEFINHLFEIKNIFLFFKLNLPKVIDFQLINMTSLLLNLFHNDGTICLFNGSNNVHLNKINQVMKITNDVLPKNLNLFKHGINVFNDKNRKIFMDLTLPTNQNINSNIHAGTLSFEFSSNNEKIITNCGSIDKRIGKNPEYLRYSAAHSTIILNNTNITELIEKKAYKRSPKNITFEKKEDPNKLSWITSHDGYLKNFQKIIKRKLIIDKKNNILSGEDSIISTKINSKKMIYHLRFHLMPECNCILTNNKKMF